MKKELNEAKKTIKKLNERLQDNMKKVRDETNQRAKAEAEGRVKDSTISALKEVLARQQTTSQQAGAGRPPSPRGGVSAQGLEKGPEICRDFLRNGFCNRNMSCKFFHPPGRIQAPSQPDNRMKPDCRFWMEGWCRKDKNICRGKHDQGKFGTQAKQPMPTTSSNVDFNNPDFVQALTKVVSQTLAGAKSAAPWPSGGQRNCVHTRKIHQLPC